MNTIWLPKKTYPDYQLANYSGDKPRDEKIHHYAIAEFKKEYRFAEKPEKISLTVTGASRFFLYVNGAFIGMGPAASGGDFRMNGPLNWEFCNRYEIEGCTELSLYAIVRLQPEVLTEFNQGVGCFALDGEALYENRSERFSTDESWLCRTANEYVTNRIYDASREKDAWVNAEKIDYPVEHIPAPIPMLDFDRISAKEGESFTLNEGDEQVLDFDRIYAAYTLLTADQDCRVTVTLGEDENTLSDTYDLTLKAGINFMTLRMFSIGTMKIKAVSCPAGTKINVHLLYSHYPFGKKGMFKTSDAGLDLSMDVCRHTLNLCRQTMHLDSPKHQELLACTGDNYIEMLMTLFDNGDMRLADLDVHRTAMWLNQNNGKMFHTTYSLIWVQMLKRLYEITGNEGTLSFCAPAVHKLMDRFDTYFGEHGIIDNPPDYMFVDWVVFEGYSMHHPPKALGQTVLNCFYYKALTDCIALADKLGFDKDALIAKAAAFKENFNKYLWNAEKRMYIDGLDVPEECPTYNYLPENPKGLVHYSRHAQALASLYGLCDEKDASYLAEVAADENNGLPLVQPYFMHFVLETVIKNGIAEKYAMKLLRKWIPMCEGCPKGLQEGWIKPEETYHFDHSHAWGGTFAYHLPLILTGLNIEKPGMSEITLSPKLYGLASAEVSFMTPFGEVTVKQEEGKKPLITAPKEIMVNIR